MARLTVTVDDHMLRRIRARARAQGISPSTLVREYLELYASGEPDRALALQTWVTTASSSRRGATDPAATGQDDRAPLRLVR